MGATIVPLNQSQKIPETPLNSRIVTQPGTHYTCPAGKKAVFTGIVQCTSRGSATSANLRDPTDTFNIASWNNVSAIQGNFLWDNLSVGAFIPILLELEAGDIIKTTQNSGTNAEFNVIGKIQETPA